MFSYVTETASAMLKEGTVRELNEMRNIPADYNNKFVGLYLLIDLKINLSPPLPLFLSLSLCVCVYVCVHVKNKMCVCMRVCVFVCMCVIN